MSAGTLMKYPAAVFFLKKWNFLFGTLISGLRARGERRPRRWLPEFGCLRSFPAALSPLFMADQPARRGGKPNAHGRPGGGCLHRDHMRSRPPINPSCRTHIWGSRRLRALTHAFGVPGSSRHPPWPVWGSQELPVLPRAAPSAQGCHARPGSVPQPAQGGMVGTTPLLPHSIVRPPPPPHLPGQREQPRGCLGCV